MPLPLEAAKLSDDKSYKDIGVIERTNTTIRHKLRKGSIQKNADVEYSSTAIDNMTNDRLHLASAKVLVVNQDTGKTIYAKGKNITSPIASITKLMTAMVLLDQHLPMDEPLLINKQDIDTVKGTTSRLRIGTKLSRQELLRLALMSSENRAASALARTSSLGKEAFVKAMNLKAAELGMTDSHFVDATGLDSKNVSTAADLAKMVQAAYQYPEIRQATTYIRDEISLKGYRHPLKYINTNVLVRKGEWNIGLSKTGYIREAGRCLVMQAQVAEQSLIIVLLDSIGENSRIGDAVRIRKWLEDSHDTSA